MCKKELFQKYAAAEHWAKIEPSELSTKELQLLRKRLTNHYPMEDFAAACRRLDPKSILSNEFTDLVLATP